MMNELVFFFCYLVPIFVHQRHKKLTKNIIINKSKLVISVFKLNIKL